MNLHFIIFPPHPARFLHRHRWASADLLWVKQLQFLPLVRPAGVVEEKSVGVNITQEDKTFIAEFYKYGFVGIMLDWIKQGMKADYHVIVEKMSTVLKGNITLNSRVDVLTTPSKCNYAML